MPRFSNRPFLATTLSFFVIPSVPGFPAAPLSSATPDVVLFKENHTQPTEAAILDRKSGEAEGSAVRPSGAPLLPATTSTTHRRILMENTNLPFVIRVGPRNRRSLGFAPPDFLLRLVALATFMRLSLRERRKRNRVQRSVAGNPGRADKKERVVARKERLLNRGIFQT
jgi:hypothetical protein